jgi:hypothetical protein
MDNTHSEFFLTPKELEQLTTRADCNVALFVKPFETNQQRLEYNNKCRAHTCASPCGWLVAYFLWQAVGYGQELTFLPSQSWYDYADMDSQFSPDAEANRQDAWTDVCELVNSILINSNGDVTKACGLFEMQASRE